MNIIPVVILLIILILMSRRQTSGNMDDTLYPFQYYNYAADEDVEPCYHYPLTYNVYGFY